MEKGKGNNTKNSALANFTNGSLTPKCQTARVGAQTRLCTLSFPQLLFSFHWLTVFSHALTDHVQANQLQFSQATRPRQHFSACNACHCSSACLCATRCPHPARSVHCPLPSSFALGSCQTSGELPFCKYVQLHVLLVYTPSPAHSWAGVPRDVSSCNNDCRPSGAGLKVYYCSCFCISPGLRDAGFSKGTDGIMANLRKG